MRVAYRDGFYRRRLDGQPAPTMGLPPHGPGQYEPGVSGWWAIPTLVAIVAFCLAFGALMCWLVPARAEAVTIYPAGGTTLTLPYADWHQKSLMPLPPQNIGVAQGPECPFYPGQHKSCALDRRVYGWDIMYLWTGDSDGLRLTYMHELGHFADFDMMDFYKRVSYQMYRGVDGVWGQPNDSSSYAAPQERFAQDYALCSIEKMADVAELVGAPCNYIRNLLGG